MASTNYGTPGRTKSSGTNIKYTVKSELSVRKPADSRAKDQKTVDHPYKVSPFLLPAVAEASLL